MADTTVIHRFIDCVVHASGASARDKLVTTTNDVCKVTCTCCKLRLVETIAKRDWTRLTSSEKEALEVAAIEVEEW